MKNRSMYVSDHSIVYGLCMFFFVLLYLICVLMCFNSNVDATENPTQIQGFKKL